MLKCHQKVAFLFLNKLCLCIVRSICEYFEVNKKESKIKATDKTIKKIVAKELKRLGHDADLNHIDTSEVTDMSNVFSCDDNYLGESYNDLNPDISKWNTSKVTSMTQMFLKCKKFNCDISGWDTHNVTTMGYMFFGCTEFNRDLPYWDVRSVTSMGGMFSECENFNGNICDWETKSLTRLRTTFNKCKKFNQDISGWDVSKVTNMYAMFAGCEVFNQDLSSWNVRKVKNMSHMFDGCTKFYKDLSKWETDYNCEYSYCFTTERMLKCKKYWPHNWPWA